MSNDQVKYKSQQIDLANKFLHQDGVLAYWTPGAGKTLGAVKAADQFGGATVITPASLQDNFKKELNKARAKGKYDIMSYEKFTGHPKDLKNRFLVLDEAHKIRTSGSKRSQEIRHAGRDAGKVLLLTGTPIQNSPAEIAPLINLVAKKNVLPLGEKDFNEKYIQKVPVNPGIWDRLVNNAKPSYKLAPKNLDDFRGKVHGLVSYYKPEKNISDFPEVTENNVKVPMDRRQEVLYKAIENELPASLKYKLNNILPPSKAESSNLNAFLSASRQLSNTANAYSVEDNTPPSPKIKYISDFIKKNPKSRELVYSNYLDSGLSQLSKELEKSKIPYGMFTGNQTRSEKAKLVSDYNTGKVRKLLVSSAGGEGLDLKKTRYVHIMEPHWNDPKIEQVIGRAARYKSHEGLPIKDRHVSVIRYSSDLPDEQPSFLGKLFGKKPTNKVTADEYLTGISADKKRLNGAFLNVLQQEGSLKKNGN